MSIRVSRGVLRTTVAVVGLAAAAAALSGCSSASVGLARRPTDHQLHRRSAARAISASRCRRCSRRRRTQVAVGPYVPPADIGGGGCHVDHAIAHRASRGRCRRSRPTIFPRSRLQKRNHRHARPAQPRPGHGCAQAGTPIPIIDSSQPQLAVVHTLVAVGQRPTPTATPSRAASRSTPSPAATT